MNTADGIPVGRIAGTPIRLSRSWFLLSLLIVFGYGSYLAERFAWLGGGAYLAALAFALLLALSVLVHELSHALTAKAFGWTVSGIQLTLMGGHTAFQAGRASAGRSALVSLAGPVANLVLAGIGWAIIGLSAPSGWEGLLLYLITTSNGFVGLFNLLPGIPLDGGYAVEALIWKATGSRETGTRAAGVLGLVAVVGLIVWVSLSGAWHSIGSVVLTLLIAFMLTSGSLQAFQNAKIRRAVGGLSVSVLQRPVMPVEPERVLADFPPLPDPRGVYAVVDAQGRGLGIVDRTAMAAAAAADDAGASAQSLMVAASWDRPVPARLHGQALVAHIAQLPGRVWPVAGGGPGRSVLFEADVIDAVKHAQENH